MSNGFDREISKRYCPLFGEIAVAKGFVTEDQVEQALTEQRDYAIFRGRHKLIGQIFFEKGWMNFEQIDRVLIELCKNEIREERSLVKRRD